MKKLAQWRRLMAAATAVDARVVDHNVPGRVRWWVYAPVGEWWLDSRGPYLVVDTPIGPDKWLVEIVDQGIERMKAGVYPAEEEA